MAERYPVGFRRGFEETCAAFGALIDRLIMAPVNGFMYHQIHPFDLPGPDGPPSEEQIGAEIGRRTGIAAAAFADRIWRTHLDQWDTQLKPAALARHAELGAVDLDALDDDALAQHLSACCDHLDQMTYQHHRFNLSAMVPIGDFALHVAGWLGSSPLPVLGVLDGYSPVSGCANPEMSEALAALRSGGHDVVLRSAAPAAERLAQLRRDVPEVDAYVRRVGPRLVEGFDVVNPTLYERPDIVLGKLLAGLEADPAEVRARADQLADDLRSRVPEEHRSTFDELLHEARLVYRLRDERGVYSDLTAIGLLRAAMLAAGRRLVARGVLTRAEDALEATDAELVALLAGDTSVASELDGRRAAREEVARSGAPRFLGPPPPAPPPVDLLPPPLARVMSAAGFMIEGVLGELEAEAGSGSVVMGIPGNAGVYEGTARLVASIEDLDRIEPGDVLLAPTTGEAFNSMVYLVGAIVTDHGSYASHAAIVAREVGFPAVVGTTNATRRIPDGARVRVDGGRGQVEILGAGA